MTTLQRRILALEAADREKDRKVEEQQLQIERLKRERMVLLEGETTERQTGESREKAWSEERVSLSLRDCPPLHR